jgi:phytase-like protein
MHGFRAGNVLEGRLLLLGGMASRLVAAVSVLGSVRPHLRPPLQHGPRREGRTALGRLFRPALLAVLPFIILPLTAAALIERHGVVTTDNETPVLYDDDEGGNASGDDPAIWVHPGDSALSIVIVTAKEGGLTVYDLASRLRHDRQ